MTYGCDVSQTCCPWNVRFAKELPEDSPFKLREAVAGKDARTLARGPGDERGRVLRRLQGLAVKRATLRWLTRNAAVVLGNVGTVDDIDVLTHALHHPEPPVRDHAARTLERIGSEVRAGPRARPHPTVASNSPGKAPTALRADE
jgi:epoxyqueuosine reductase